MAVNRKQVNPTKELYEQLQAAYEHFNNALFEGELPNSLITIQREKSTKGFSSPFRWGNPQGMSVHEIAINPVYFSASSFAEFFLMLVHEQCHIWQYSFGTPSRPGYHNKEWARKMVSLGVIPSSTGNPGGSMTGQKMAGYMTENGKFKASAYDLVKSGFCISWYELNGSKSNEHKDIIDIQDSGDVEQLLKKPMIFETTGSEPSPPRYDKSKVKYFCPSCESNVWGRQGLSLRCEDCKKLLMVA